GWYAHIPGLRVLTPAMIDDARYMLIGALTDPNPTIIFEHVMLYNMEGALSADAEMTAVDIDHAKVRRAGADISLITYGGSLFKTLAAAESLARDGIDAEVVDLRTLRPLDNETIMARRCVIVDEGWRSGSISAEVGMRIAEQAFFELDAPPRRVCGREVPMPYAAHLEDASLPQPEDVVAAARELVRPT
ncbi:MAG TPA: transketolase C-terminal domain-containing protein, partial [Roseiarcus sp.]|nr:transketolase C-terminal domain-containing protein [Roseiarcus sp.]